MNKKTFIIEGMACAACSAAVERAVKRINGIERCDVNLATGKMEAEYSDLVSPEKIVEAIEAVGFGAVIQDEKKN